MDAKAIAEAMKIAQTGSDEERLALAERDDVSPELLFYLAEDKSAKVRAAVAINENTPRQADEFLSKDGDDDVRMAVSAKMETVAATLSSERREKQKDLTLEVMENLAFDAVAKVRARLAESLKNIEEAPEEMIERVVEVLARDTAIEVAGPILENSKLLTDEFLIDLVKTTTTEGSRSAVARRDGVSEKLSDAIVASADDDAVAALLGNESAQIREETLDQLIEAAPSKTSWHEPLVKRPKLTGNQADRLGSFVASALVKALVKRADLPDDVSKRLEEVMSERLKEEKPSGFGKKKDKTASDRNAAVELFNEGKLEEDEMASAVASGRRAFVLVALSLKSGLDEPTVNSIMSSGSAKAICAATWKAGFSAEFAEQLQLRLGYIDPDKVIRQAGNGGFQLSTDELEWEIDLFSDMTE